MTRILSIALQLLVLILLISNGYTRAGAVELDRMKSRQMALAHSNQLKLSENQLEQAELQEKIAWAAHLPEFSASGLYFYSPDKVEFTVSPESMLDLEGGLGDIIRELLTDFDVDLGLSGITMAGAQLEQAVYMGGRIRAARGMAQKATEVNSLDIELNHSEVVALADAAYYRYITLQEKKLAAVEYKELLDELEAKLEESLEEGMITRNELLKARVERNEAILMVQQASSGTELARMDLCRVIGLPLDTQIRTTEKPEPESLDFSGLLQEDPGPENRPEYRMLEKSVSLGRYHERMVRADMLPSIGLSAGYNYFGGLEIVGSSVQSAAFSSMAMIRIPVFNWNESRNQLSVARLKTEAARIEKEDAGDQLKLDIARNRFKLEDAITRLNLTSQALEQAEENLETSQDMFDQGMETLVDLLEAQAQWQSAKSDHIEAQASVLLRRTMYLKSTGELSAEIF